MKKINSAKLYSPLILVDPVQKDRNVAAALSEERYEKFKQICKEYLKKPNNKFFQKKEISLSKLKKSGYIIIEALPLDTKKDIAGAKLLKVFGFIKQRLISEGFNLTESNWKWDGKNAYFWYKIDGKLSKFRKHYGPMVKHKEDLQRFMVKWASYRIFKEDGRVYITIERAYRNVKEFLKEIIKEETVISKVNKIKLI